MSRQAAARDYDPEERDRSALLGRSTGGSSKPRASAGASAPTPIFALDRDDHWRIPGLRMGAVRLLAAGGGTVVVVTSDGHILRWGMDRGEPPEGAWGWGVGKGVSGVVREVVVVGVRLSQGQSSSGGIQGSRTWALSHAHQPPPPTPHPLPCSA